MVIQRSRNREGAEAERLDQGPSLGRVQVRDPFLPAQVDSLSPEIEGCPCPFQVAWLSSGLSVEGSEGLQGSWPPWRSGCRGQAALPLD